jgi:hypothetical protein
MAGYHKGMDNKNSVVKKPKRTPPQQPLDTKSHGTTGPEIWDGNNAGWTLVSYKRKKKNKK